MPLSADERWKEMSEKKCSCNAYMAGECVCGAWDDNDLLAANKEIDRLKDYIRIAIGGTDALMLLNAPASDFDVIKKTLEQSLEKDGE
jgi:hypothetical protein